MNETIITWNVPNMITIFLMVLVMFVGVNFVLTLATGKAR